MNTDQLIQWCHEHNARVEFQSGGDVVVTIRTYPEHIAPSLKEAVEGLQKDIEERSFLQTVSEKDYPVVHYLLYPFPPSRALDEAEKKELATMLAKYSEMAKYL